MVLSMKVDGSLSIRVLIGLDPRSCRNLQLQIVGGPASPTQQNPVVDFPAPFGLPFLRCRQHQHLKASVQNWSLTTSSSCRSSLDTARQEVQRQDFVDHLMSPCHVVLNLSCVLSAAAHDFGSDKKLSPLPQSWLKRTEDLTWCAALSTLHYHLPYWQQTSAVIA